MSYLTPGAPGGGRRGSPFPAPGNGLSSPAGLTPPGLSGGARPGAGRTAAGAGAPGLGVPGYAHPLVAPMEWAELTRPATPLHWAVLNVANGPGSRPDPHCLAAAGRLTNARLRVLGHLDLAYGGRPLAELVADARRFLDWYRVGGFYLDRCPAGRAELPHVRRVTATLETLLDAGPGGGGPYGSRSRPYDRGPYDSGPYDSGSYGGSPYGGSPYDGGYLVLGHGIHPHPGYAAAADQLVTFSGPWSDYRWSQAAAWTAEYPPERFVHLVHGVPRTHLDEALRIARWQGAGTVFFTDRGAGANRPFENLPGFWDEFVSRIGRRVLE
ncbi:spherulation-specific family 4 protein [Streptomyces sp. NPDC093085]|uniref:spherulation-specific family 4 protein n=1 Tax=Streptomyces sp. NPDC093085 TaxID=3155068 RepID=UPI0034373C86